MKYVKGNVFELIPTDKPVVFPHVVNNIGAFGAGIAAGIAQHWPIVRDQYLEWHGSMGHELGTCQVVEVGENLTVVNMVAQAGLIGRGNPHPLKYEALRKCMEMVPSVVRISTRLGVQDAEIHTVKFGSGLAGGDWDRIEEMIDEIWGEIPVTIYYVEDK